MRTRRTIPQQSGRVVIQAETLMQPLFHLGQENGEGIILLRLIISLLIGSQYPFYRLDQLVFIRNPVVFQNYAIGHGSIGGIHPFNRGV